MQIDSTILTMIACTIAMAAVMVTMFLWIRSEANSDRRHFMDIQREDRKELLQISKNLEFTVQAIQKEINDFHYKLCEIKEGKK